MGDVWIQTTIGDISDFVSTRHLPSRLNPETPYVGLEHIEPRSPRIDDWGSVEGVASQVTPFEPEDVLFGRLRPYLHKVVSADFSGVCSPEVLVLRANHRCLPKFLYLICSAEETVRACVSMSAGTRMPRTSTTDLASIALQLPSLEEQKRIVNLVSAVDEYIAALERQADAARTARNAVLHELLTAGGDDWVETTFKSFVAIQRGHDLPLQSRNPGTVPVVASNGVVGWHDEAKWVGPAIITGRSGTIGKVFYLEEPCWPLNTTLYVTDFKGNLPRFIALVLEFMRLETFAGGSTVPSLDRNVLFGVRVIVPPLAQQQRIVDVISSIDEMVHAADKALVDAKTLRSGILSDLLSGEHEIPESYDRLLGAA